MAVPGGIACLSLTATASLVATPTGMCNLSCGRTYIKYFRPCQKTRTLGVLYHLENIPAAVRRLRELLNDAGILYLETQMSLIESSLPIYEAASGIYPTIAKQYKEYLHATGISNFLFPNEAATPNLAYSYDFTCERLRGAYTRDYSS